jgi:putative DNA primase/helicase
MLGDRTTILGFSELENPRFALGGLLGKTLAIGYEQPVGKLNSSYLLNTIISGETVTSERKFKDPVEIKPCCKFIAAMNSLPVIHSTNDGLFRRVKIVKFPSLEENKRDPYLKERIKNEGPGIFNWALEGLLRLRNNKVFSIPDCVIAATSEYKKNSDIPSEFISDCCIVGPKKKIQSQILYDSYKEWCLKNGHKSLSITLAAREWERLGFHKYATDGKKFWRGVEMRVAPSIKVDTVDTYFH